MKEEVQCACDLFSKLLETRNLPRQFVQPFRVRLGELLAERFREHWDINNPTKGSGYRCIRINSKMDPIISNAAKATGLKDISKYLPVELTMWIDPGDVSYRIGEEGSVCSVPTFVKRSDSAPNNSTSPPRSPPFPSFNSHSPPRSPPPHRSLSGNHYSVPSPHRFSPTSHLATSPYYHHHHHRSGQSSYSTNRSSPMSSRLIQVQV